jgi:hypothetical protein
MNPQQRKGRIMVLLKMLVLVITCLSFLGVLSCNPGTGSTSSSSGGIGTNWSVTIEKFASTVSISKGESSMVIVRVKDPTGAPAPKTTRVCLSVSFGSIWVDEAGEDNPIRTGCVPTSNDIGQLFGNYHPPDFTGTDYIQATSQGAIGSTTIEVVP